MYVRIQCRLVYSLIICQCLRVQSVIGCRSGSKGVGSGGGRGPVKFLTPLCPPPKKKSKIRPSLAKIFC